MNINVKLERRSGSRGAKDVRAHAHARRKFFAGSRKVCGPIAKLEKLFRSLN